MHHRRMEICFYFYFHLKVSHFSFLFHFCHGFGLKKLERGFSVIVYTFSSDQTLWKRNECDGNVEKKTFNTVENPWHFSQQFFMTFLLAVSQSVLLAVTREASRQSFI